MACTAEDAEVRSSSGDGEVSSCLLTLVVRSIRLRDEGVLLYYRVHPFLLFDCYPLAHYCVVDVDCVDIAGKQMNDWSTLHLYIH